MSSVADHGGSDAAVQVNELTEEVTMNAVTGEPLNPTPRLDPAPYYAPIRAEAVDEITKRAEWLQRQADSYECRLENAKQAGDDLARVVYEFTEDPEGVGTDRLREAYRTFMGLSAGAFTADHA